MSPKPTPWLPRFWAKVALPDENGCMIWTGGIKANGYGQFQLNNRGKNWYAHRLSYTLLVGVIPTGLDLDHLCRVRSCVAPGHLEPVTRKENLNRGVRARKSN